MNPDSLTATCQRLEDHRDVSDIVLRYARAVDRMDWELLRSCYHHDAVDDHGPFKGTVDELVNYLRADLAKFDFTTHYIVNQLVELDGDVAWVESYCYALHRTSLTDERRTPYDWQANVRYIDRMERRNGEWRIADRRLVWEGGRFDPVAKLPETRPFGRTGRRDRYDIAYGRSR